MADNIELNSASGGAIIAADDISSVWYQISKLAFGPLNTATLVTASVGLPIQEVAAMDVSAATVTVDLGGNNDVTIDASSIVLAEDVAHSTGDAGVQMLAVRKATPADLSNADGDYEPLQLDNGRLWASTLVTGDALTALELIDDVVAVLGTATYTETSTKGNVIGVVRNDTLAALAGTDNEIAPLQVNASGALYIQEGAALDVSAATVTVDGTGTFVVQEDGAALTALELIDDVVYNEDVGHSAADPGVAVYAIRDDALAADAAVGADLDYTPFRVTNLGALWTTPSANSLGGCKAFTSVDLDQTEEDIATGACTVYGIYAWNATAAPLWLQIFNTNTVTVGTTAPDHNFIVPANADSDGAGVVIPIPVQGLAFSTALTVAMTTGVGTDDGAPGANEGGVFVTYQD